MKKLKAVKEGLQQRLGKSRAALSDGISALFRGGRAMDATLLGELEELLYTADLGPLATGVVDELTRLHKRERGAARPDFEFELGGFYNWHLRSGI